MQAASSSLAERRPGQAAAAAEPPAATLALPNQALPLKATVLSTCRQKYIFLYFIKERGKLMRLHRTLLQAGEAVLEESIAHNDT